MKIDQGSIETEQDVYEQFLTDSTFEHVAAETNRYATSYINSHDLPVHSPARKWVPTNTGEVKIFWALCLLMGVLGKPVISLYWSTRDIIATPFFGKVMTRDRFQLLLRFLHFNDNSETNKADKLYKIRPIYDSITRSFSKVYTPSINLSIDEAMIRYFGRLSFKTYNPKKPAKYGMKAYKICDATGYTYRFRMYLGKEETGKPGIINLVLDMMKDLLYKGYRLFMDNWYSSPLLFRELWNRQTHAAGTVRMTRKFMPKDFEPKGEKVQVRKSDELLCVRWKDKRDVTMLTNMHGSGMGSTGKKNKKKH